MDSISELAFGEFNSAHRLSEQRELFLACFPENAGTSSATVEHYYWKFHTSIAEFPAHEYVATENASLVAYYAALPYRYSMNGVERVAAMVCDVMTHPRMRGKGVFTKMGLFSTALLAQAGFDFTTGFPVRQEVIPGHLKAGWHIVQRLPLYTKVLRANDLLRSRKFPGVLALPVNAALWAGRAALRLRSNNQYTAQILNKPQFLSLPDYEEFARRWRSGLRNALIKDNRFMNWRTGAPEATYDFITVRDASGELACVSVLRATALQGVKTLGVVDLMVLAEHALALNAFGAALSDVARRRKAEVVAMMLSSYWAKKHRLWRFGFFRSPAVFSVIVKLLNPKLDLELFRPECDWHLTWIDSDDL